MHALLRQFVAWALILQVSLIGAVGTGLHDWLGCQHGPCVGECCTATREASPAGCQCCDLCRAASGEDSLPSEGSKGDDGRATIQGVPSVHAATCHDCALCDLLDQYHQAAPAWGLALEAELIVGETELLRENAAIAAAIRLAHSRGPPAV